MFFLSRNFRCDCGNSKFKNLQCKLLPVSSDIGFIGTEPKSQSWEVGALASAGSCDASAFPSELSEVGVLQQKMKLLRDQREVLQGERRARTLGCCHP